MQFPSTVNYQEFDSLSEQSRYLCETVINILSHEITEKGTATLAVSGGSTPKALFDYLSQADIAWHKVTITLVDDRWVDPDENDSNQKLLSTTLLQSFAKKANFIPLYQPGLSAAEAQQVINERFNSVSLPFDVVLLGMGDDGHTASLFPCSAELEKGFSTQETYLATTPTTAPHCRITLSADSISQAKNLFLQLKGDNKKTTLKKVLQSQDFKAMPIRYFLQQPISVLWCP